MICPPPNSLASSTAGFSGGLTRSSLLATKSSCLQRTCHNSTLHLNLFNIVKLCNMHGTPEVWSSRKLYLTKADLFIGKPEGSFSLPYATLRAFKWDVLGNVPFRLIMIALSYCQPFIISRAIAYVIEPVTQSSRDVGIELLAAAFVVYVGLAVGSSL
jgi:hypothetical protein